MSPQRPHGGAARGQVWAVRSAWMFTGDSPPREGLVTIADGRVIAVGENQSGGPPCDLGEVALLPPLVNVHTHLEFSDLDAPLGARGLPLPAWIGAVVGRRRAELARDDAADRRAAAIGQGLDECAARGVGLVGDIVTPPPRFDSNLDTEPARDVAANGFRVDTLAFHELLSLDESLIPTLLAPYVERPLDPLAPGPRWGLSPHAPYSTTASLVTETCQFALRRALPVAMHLAESPEELELLETGSGPFRELLERVGAWRGAELFAGRGIRWHLERLATTPKALVVHGNYLSAEDRRFVADHRDNLSIVYCPRTHDHFAHREYPLVDLLDRGARIALGTDSRASSPDLDVLAELRCVAARRPEVAPRRLLPMITTDAAAAIGWPSSVATIGIGATRLVIVPLSAGAGRDPWEQLCLGGPSRGWQLSEAPPV